MADTKELVTTARQPALSHWVNDLTRFMDEYRTGTSLSLSYYTYIYSADQESTKYYIIRLPGSSRGYIEVDEDMVIKDICLYEKQCFTFFKDYKPELANDIKRFIGMKLKIVLKEEKTNE